MNAISNWVIGVTSLLCLLPYLDRLRSMNWVTHQPRVVGMHLLMALWLGAVAYDAIVFCSAPWYQLLAIGSAAFWLRVSWVTWRAGPPLHTESGPVPLEEVSESS